MFSGFHIQQVVSKLGHNMCHKFCTSTKISIDPSKLTCIVIIGPPGSGKGTICKRLKKDFGFLHLSSGDLLRSQIEGNSEIGFKAKEYIEAGSLVPDELVMNLMLSDLKSRTGRVLLDGFPRTAQQCIALEKSHRIKMAINLDVGTEEIVSRISERWTHVPSGRVYSACFNPPKVKAKDDETGEPLVRRPDDHPSNVRERLAVYESQTRPLLLHYRKRAVLKSFDGNEHSDLVRMDRRSDAIYKQIEKLMDSKMAKL